jgi:hypothetical protein
MEAVVDMLDLQRFFLVAVHSFPYATAIRGLSEASENGR